jgi:hypothetical protein
MTDLTEKNLEAVLLNLTKTDKPITVKPTTWFGNPAKTAQWYTCPHCAKLSPLTLEWVGLTQDELNMIGDSMRTWNSWTITDVYFAIEAKLKDKNI